MNRLRAIQNRNHAFPQISSVLEPALHPSPPYRHRVRKGPIGYSNKWNESV